MMNKSQKVIIAIVTVLVILIGGMTRYVSSSSNHLKQVVSKGYLPIKNDYKGKNSKTSESFLIMGLDNTIERKLGTTRTDSLMVVTINHKTKKITFCSLPRDSFVKIDADKYHGMQRVEAAYTYDGPTASVNTVQKLLNIPIDHYYVFNFLSFVKIIDAIGGVDINVKHDFVGVTKDGSGGIVFKKGKQHVNGLKALSYARERHSDNDIMRGYRQQEIIQAVEKKIKSPQTITKIPGIVDAIDHNIQTNINSNELDKLIKNAPEYANYKKQRITFDWRTFSNQGRSMIELYPDSISNVSHQLRVSLGLSNVDYRDKAQYQFHTNGNYLFQSDYTVQDKFDEDSESTSINGNNYVGINGNTKTGPLPTTKTKNGFVTK